MELFITGEEHVRDQESIDSEILRLAKQFEVDPLRMVISTNFDAVAGDEFKGSPSFRTVQLSILRGMTQEIILGCLDARTSTKKQDLSRMPWDEVKNLLSLCLSQDYYDKQASNQVAKADVIRHYHELGKSFGVFMSEVLTKANEIFEPRSLLMIDPKEVGTVVETLLLANVSRNELPLHLTHGIITCASYQNSE